MEHNFQLASCLNGNADSLLSRLIFAIANPLNQTKANVVKISLQRS